MEHRKREKGARIAPGAAKFGLAFDFLCWGFERALPGNERWNWIKPVWNVIQVVWVGENCRGCVASPLYILFVFTTRVGRWWWCCDPDRWGVDLWKSSSSQLALPVWRPSICLDTFWEVATEMKYCHRCETWLVCGRGWNKGRFWMTFDLWNWNELFAHFGRLGLFRYS